MMQRSCPPRLSMEGDPFDVTSCARGPLEQAHWRRDRRPRHHRLRACRPHRRDLRRTRQPGAGDVRGLHGGRRRRRRPAHHHHRRRELSRLPGGHRRHAADAALPRPVAALRHAHRHRDHRPRRLEPPAVSPAQRLPRGRGAHAHHRHRCHRAPPRHSRRGAALAIRHLRLRGVRRRAADLPRQGAHGHRRRRHGRRRGVAPDQVRQQGDRRPSA